MVAEGSAAWIEIGDSTLFESRLPAGVTASLFVNAGAYLALANYGAEPYSVATREDWRDRESGRQGRLWPLPPRRLTLLARAAKTCT